MNPSWLLIIACLAGLFAMVSLLIRAVSRREQFRRRRLDLLEEALGRGDMDAELRREVVTALRTEQAGRFTWRHLWFSAGWLGMFTGGGMAVFGSPRTVDAGLMVMLAAFAVVTLPLALRELDSRRAPVGESAPGDRLGRALDQASKWCRRQRHSS